jgi:hypothetical protein
MLLGLLEGSAHQWLDPKVEHQDLDGKEKAAAEVDGMGKVVRRSQGLGGA